MPSFEKSFALTKSYDFHMLAKMHELMARYLNPPSRQVVSINTESMVLWCDVALAIPAVNTWLVHPTISVRHFLSSPSCITLFSQSMCQVMNFTNCQSKQLIPKADAEDGLVGIDSLLDAGDCFTALRGITRTVTQEESIILLFREVIVPRHDDQLHLPHSQSVDASVRRCSDSVR